MFGIMNLLYQSIQIDSIFLGLAINFKKLTQNFINLTIETRFLHSILPISSHLIEIFVIF